MIAPSHPHSEPERLTALHSLYILDTPPEERFDRITRLATELFGVPISYVALVDENRVWYKSAQGLGGQEIDRNISFCAHAILDPGKTLVINDAHRDERFHDNPFVTEPAGLRFLRRPAAALAGRSRARHVLHRRHREPRLQ